MKSIFRKVGIWIFAFCLFPFAGIAADTSDFGDIKVIKSIEKSYRLESNDVVEIFNKYGKINVNTWSKSQVYVEVTIISYGHTEASAQARINNLEIEEQRPGNKLKLSTLSHEGPKVRLDKKGLSVTFDVSLPASHPLILHNEFGDINLGDRQGKVDINLHHGSLFAGRLSSRKNSITSNFGKADIGYISGGELDFSYGKLTIDRAKDIYLKSNGTEVIIEAADNLEIDGKLGDIWIGRVNTLLGSYASSCFKVDHLGTRLDMKVKHASCFKINEVGLGFQEINLVSNYSEIVLGFDTGSNFKLEANTQNAQLNYGGQTVSMTILESGNNLENVTYLGKFGNPSSQSPKVILNCTNGNVEVNQ